MNSDFIINRLRRIAGSDRIELSRQGNSKTVLLSYLTMPWRIKDSDKRWHSHSNLWECKEIADTWIRNGYDVDVIDWDNYWFVPDKRYSVFIDIHSNMERLYPYLGKTCLKILHVTGSHWWFQNSEEFTRLRNLFIRRDENRKDSWIKPRRQVPKSDAINYADYVTILGNTTTWKTFGSGIAPSKPVFFLSGSTTKLFPFVHKDFQTARKNFLWMGSDGAVLRGLDLVLEAFAGMRGVNLTVVGAVEKERDFVKEYRNELYKTTNIRTVGYMDVASKRFENILETNAFLIYPTGSEGQAGSVITCMHGGLVPVVSDRTGVDIGHWGVVLNECSVSEIQKTVARASDYPAGVVSKMAQDTRDYARATHTRQRFAEDYENAVLKMLR